MSVLGRTLGASLPALNATLTHVETKSANDKKDFREQRRALPFEPPAIQGSLVEICLIFDGLSSVDCEFVTNNNHETACRMVFASLLGANEIDHVAGSAVEVKSVRKIWGLRENSTSATEYASGIATSSVGWRVSDRAEGKMLVSTLQTLRSQSLFRDVLSQQTNGTALLLKSMHDDKKWAPGTN